MKRQIAIFATVGVGVVFATLVAATGETGARTQDSASAERRPYPAVLHVSTPPPARSRKPRIVAGLDEPLVPTGPTSTDEDLALDAAIVAFQATATSRDASFPLAPFQRFVESHPQSGWRVALLTNLGFAYYRAGYFERALASWQAAWRQGRDASDPRARALVDRAVGELARMHARLGHADELERLFGDIGNRALTGQATETMTGAREGAWVMRNEPGVAYLCGPSALKNLLVARNASPKELARLDQQRSGRRGFSLAQLAGLAEQTKLRYRLIHRQPGQAIPVPSIVHWNVHHFAAIVDERDGGYVIKDPTFGFGTDELWVRADAIDSETSGFFLVPKDAPQDPRWRRASLREAAGIYGKGYTGVSQVGATTPGDETIRNQCSDPNSPTSASSDGIGMCGYNAHTMLASLTLNDTPVGYAPAKGPPVFIRLTYNQREANQPAIFGFFNVSPKWTLNVLSYIQDRPEAAGVGVLRYVAGGGSVSYPTNGGPFDPETGEFAPEAQTQAVLVRIPAAGPVTSYELRMPNGGKQVFALLDGAVSAPRRVFLTQIVDPDGNALTLNYDGQLRLTSITDATGRNTTFGYEAADPLLVTRVTDPFGRAAAIRYLPSGQLESITDVIGLTSSVTYDDSGLVNSLTTPYGTTRFSYGQYPSNGRFLEIVDPMGYAERLEFLHRARGIAGIDAVAPPSVDNEYLNWRNSFYWDKHALPLARPTTSGALDYTKARLSHWLHTTAVQTAPTLESTKNPLENRVWRTYAGQRWTYFEGAIDLPATVSRVLDDNIATQIASATYNRRGKPLTAVDPRGRQTVFTYDANDIDLLTIEQQVSDAPTPELATLARFTYNAQHLPLTATDASGQTTSYAYNAAGQLIVVTDAQQHATTYGYDPIGRLITVTDARGAAVVTLTYDEFDRVATRTDAAGATVAYQYDALNRVTRAAYPDGTSEQYAYDKLDLVSATDRRGNATTYTYDANRRRTSVTDPLGHVTRFDYYENGVLKSITDPNGHVTSWDIDVQSRPIAKHYANGTTETVTYEATTSRIASVTDALGQFTVYGYDIDNRVTSIAYPNAQQPTAPVQFAHDPAFPRLASMTDGNGETRFSYHPIATPPTLGAGQLRSIETPVAGAPSTKDTITYAYDELGRVTGKTVNGSQQSVTFDALGRPESVANPLDKFTYRYADATPRVSAIASKRGPRVDMDYFGPKGDLLLQQVTYTPSAGTAPLAQYSYTYDANHNILTFTRQEPDSAESAQSMAKTAGATTPRTTGSSAAGATTRRTKGSNASGATTPRTKGSSAGGMPSSAYRFVAARSVLVGLACLALALVFALVIRIRSSAKRASRFVLAAGLGTLCYLLSCSGAGQGEVTTYGYDEANRLISASGGTDPAQPMAYTYDPASNITSVTGGVAPATTAYTETNAIAGATYDASGSPTALDGSNYVWDAANRLIAATKDGVETHFTYDGLSRIVRIVEKNGADTLSDRAYTWCGATRCLEHDNLQAGSPVSRQYFAQGVLTGSDSLYYVTDHLGSVRQLVDAAGKVRARYSYDPYGAATKLSGDLDADIGFAGLPTTSHAGLNLAVYRAYDPQHQRWLNRDPIGENGGLNLYGYASQNPVRNIDPYGLYDWNDFTIDYSDAEIAILQGWAGFSDSVTFSVSNWARNQLGTNYADHCSTSYQVGQWIPAVVGGARLLYAGLAKLVSLAPGLSGADAAAARNTLKYVFRVGLGGNYRMYSLEELLARYGSDEATTPSVVAEISGTEFSVQR